jgi:hypothetical protein
VEHGHKNCQGKKPEIFGRGETVGVLGSSSIDTLGNLEPPRRGP